MTDTEYRSELEPPIDTPYLPLPGEIWCVYCRYLGENWPRYSGVPNSQTRLTINAVEKKSQVFFHLLQFYYCFFFFFFFFFFGGGGGGGGQILPSGLLLRYVLLFRTSEYDGTLLHTVWYCYNVVNFLPNPHNRHPIARPSVRDMGYIL